MAKKKTQSKVVEINANQVIDSIGEEAFSRLNEGRIKAAEENLENLKKRISTKVYAIQFESMEQIERYMDFMENKASWKEKEALGVIEICRVLDQLKSDGIKNNILYMQALPLEASHYFISKQAGTGLIMAKDFISMLKPFEQGLESAKSDAQEVQVLEKELAAAQQGIELA